MRASEPRPHPALFRRERLRARLLRSQRLAAKRVPYDFCFSISAWISWLSFAGVTFVFL
jgi:hypothetical protein